MPERRPAAGLTRQGRWLQDRGPHPAPRQARGSTSRRAEGPFSPWGIRPKASPAREAPEGAVPEGPEEATRQQQRRTRQRGSGGIGTSDCQAHAVRNCGRRSTRRPVRNGKPAQRDCRECGADRKNPAPKGGGSEGQGTADGRGELRRWKARVPAAATVGAGSNAGPHLCLGLPRREPGAASRIGTKLTQLTQSRGQTVTPPATRDPAHAGPKMADCGGFAGHSGTMPQSDGCRTVLYK